MIGSNHNKNAILCAEEFYGEELLFNGRLITLNEEEERLKELERVTLMKVYFGDQSIKNPECYSRFVKGLLTMSCLKELQLYFSAQTRVSSLHISNLGKGICNLSKHLHSLTLAFSLDSIQNDDGSMLLNTWLGPLVHLEELHLIVSRHLCSPSTRKSDQEQPLQLIKQLGQGLGQLKNLKRFSCSCRLSCGEMTALLHAMEPLQTLEQLTLEISREVSLDSHLVEVLCRLVQRNSNTLLAFGLQLWATLLQRTDMRCLFETILLLKHLTKLHLAFGEDTHVELEQLQQLSSSLQQLSSSLESLHLSFGRKNGLRQKGAQSLSKGLQYLTRLSTLELRIDEGNFLGTWGVQSIGLAFTHLASCLSSLTLQIHESRMDMYGVNRLFNSLSQLTNLTQLALQLFVTANGASEDDPASDEEEERNNPTEELFAAAILVHSLVELRSLKKLQVFHCMNCYPKASSSQTLTWKQRQWSMRRLQHLVTLS